MTTIWQKVTLQERVMGKIQHGADLLDELTKICHKNDIRLGRISALGAVKCARFGYYDQQAHEYRFMGLDRPLEIINLTGNVSLKEQKPFVHAHITFAGEDGTAYGGHLAQGTIVFACEFVIEIFNGPKFERNFDRITGLALWGAND